MGNTTTGLYMHQKHIFNGNQRRVRQRRFEKMEIKGNTIIDTRKELSTKQEELDGFLDEADGSEVEENPVREYLFFEKVKRNRYLDTVDVLQQGGIDIDKKDEGGLTALYIAAKSGNLAMVKLLIEHGANPNIPMAHNINALDIAMIHKHKEVYNLLYHMGGRGMVFKKTPIS